MECNSYKDKQKGCITYKAISTKGFVLCATSNFELHNLNKNDRHNKICKELCGDVIKEQQNLDRSSSRYECNTSEFMIKTENNIQKDATADESMAAEALRELGVNVTNHKNTYENPNVGCDTNGHRFETDNHIVHYDTDQQLLCGIISHNKSELVNHIGIHDQDKIQRCPVCAHEFQRPSSLTNHMKIHSYTPGRAVNPKDVNIEPESVEQWTNDQFISSGDNVNMYSFAINVTDHVDNIALEIDVNTTNIEDEYQDLALSGPVNELLHDIKVESDISRTDTKCNLNNASNREILSNKRPHICKLCGIGFSRMKALVSHERLHQDVPLECGNCDEILPNESSLTKHNISCFRKKSQANITSKNFKMTDNESSKLFTVNDVNSKTEAPIIRKLPNLKIPEKVKHHACPDCPKYFATKQKMFRHMWIHRKKTFTCEICALTFEQQNELDEHRLSQHPGDSPYLCQECGKCFASRQGLWEHGRVHNLGGNTGQFHCTECNKQFASRQGFLIHTRTHTGERPYGCRYCWKAFRDGGTLRKHERIHTGERPHSCPLCPRAFNQKVVLREHIRWVHAANKTENLDAIFQCQLCRQILSDREELCAHIVKHSDQIAAETKLSALKGDTSRTKSAYVKNKCTKQTKMRKTNNCISSVPRQASQYGEYKLNFSCDLCGLLFDTREILRNHVKVHI